MTTKVLDYKFLMGFFGPSPGELWASRAITLPMPTALGRLCCGGRRGQGTAGRDPQCTCHLSCTDVKNPVALGKPPWFVSRVVHVKKFPTVIDFSCQDQGEHVHPA